MNVRRPRMVIEQILEGRLVPVDSFEGHLHGV